MRALMSGVPLVRSEKADTPQCPWSQATPPPRRMLISGVAVTLLPRTGYAADPATPEEAKTLAEKAAAHFKDVGPEKAIADFNDPAGGYVDRELFVVVYDPNNRVVGSFGVPAFRRYGTRTQPC
jgi:hypothetical protein